jgi:hypothetical protein
MGGANSKWKDLLGEFSVQSLVGVKKVVKIPSSANVGAALKARCDKELSLSLSLSHIALR